MPFFSGPTVQASAGITSPLASLSRNGVIESLNGRLRGEMPNEARVGSLSHARAVLETRRADYNTHLPHSQFGWTTLSAFASTFRPRRDRALRYAKGSAPDLTAHAMHTTNHDAMNELTTG